MDRQRRRAYQSSGRRTGRVERQSCEHWRGSFQAESGFEPGNKIDQRVSVAQQVAAISGTTDRMGSATDAFVRTNASARNVTERTPLAMYSRNQRCRPAS